MPHKERLGGEGIRLDLNIRSGHFVHEARLAHVGETAHQYGPSVGVYGRQSCQVLSHLLQIQQTLVLPLHDGTHPPQAGLLQQLAPIQRVTILHQADIILGHVIDEVFGRVDLPQSKLVMILVIQHVHKVGIERVDVIQLREFLYDC